MKACLAGWVVAASLITFAATAAAQSDTSGSGSSDSAAAGASATASSGGTTQVVEPPPVDDTASSNVYEKPGKTYYFIGLDYRGTVIPKFEENLFVDGGKTVYSNTVRLDLDMRKDGFSFVPHLQYTEYGVDDLLFHEKNKNDQANNWSVVNSSMKGLYLGTDLLWSSKVATTVDFEFGVGLGVGVIFGDLSNNWVYDDPNGALINDDGRHFSKCQQGDVAAHPDACSPVSHSNSTDTKVGNYTEKSWVNGGSKPNVFLDLSIPILGLRIKPVKELVIRPQVGWSLTGFWFSLGGYFGLEKALEKKADQK